VLFQVLLEGLLQLDCHEGYVKVARLLCGARAGFDNPGNHGATPLVWHLKADLQRLHNSFAE